MACQGIGLGTWRAHQVCLWRRGTQAPDGRCTAAYRPLDGHAIIQRENRRMFAQTRLFGDRCSLYVGSILDKTPTMVSARSSIPGALPDSRSMWCRMAATFFQTQIRLSFSFSRLERYRLAHKHAIVAMRSYRLKTRVPTMPISDRDASIIRDFPIHSPADDAPRCYLCRRVGLQ